MLKAAIANLESLLPIISVHEAERLQDIVNGRFSVYTAQAFLQAYRRTPELGKAVEAVIESMEPYEALLRLEHAVMTARIEGTDQASPKAALYAEIDLMEIEQLREYGEYRKGAVK